jgi:hypothetical protein
MVGARCNVFFSLALISLLGYHRSFGIDIDRRQYFIALTLNDQLFLDRQRKDERTTSGCRRTEPGTDPSIQRSRRQNDFRL